MMCYNASRVEMRSRCAKKKRSANAERKQWLFNGVLGAGRACLGERSSPLLGKDEVASSNLASSSKKKVRPKGWTFFLAIDRFERSNAARMSAAGDGWTEPNHYFCPKMAKMQTNLASSSTKKPRTPTGFRLSSFLCHMVLTQKTDTETDTALFSYAKIYYDRQL